MIYFTVSDIHSFYYPFRKALDEAGFDPQNESHCLIVAGDLFDRGDDTVALYDYVDSLPRKILIRGNHEDLLEEMVERGEPWDMDDHNGTLKTVLNFNGFEMWEYWLGEIDFPKNTRKTRQLVKWIDDNFVDYAEFSKYVVVHSWLPCKYVCSKEIYEAGHYVTDPNWRKASEKKWKDSRWGNPFNCMGMSVPKGKRIIAGHWHSSYAWHMTNGTPEFGEGANYGIWTGSKLVMIDACTAASGKCNVFVFEDDRPANLGSTRKQRIKKSKEKKI